MMRSLYSAVSGLQTHQTKMDVLGNNIANVNTTGFKKGQVTFHDMLSQTLSDATEGDDSTGGINAKQVGTGVMVGAINNIHTQGAPTTTGLATHLMIQGEGFFILEQNDKTYYTRAGAFTMDNHGNLVNSANGALVCDYYNGAPITIGDYGGNISIAADGTISYTSDSGEAKKHTQTIGLATFSNPAGLKKAGENMYIESDASGEPSPDAANGFDQPGTGSAGTLISGALEMSNVDLAQEFVDMIITQRGFQANSRTIRVSDEMLQEVINIKR
jgi:flagellar hook protein FlgE